VEQDFAEHLYMQRLLPNHGPENICHRSRSRSIEMRCEHRLFHGPHQ